MYYCRCTISRGRDTMLFREADCTLQGRTRCYSRSLTTVLCFVSYSNQLWPAPLDLCPRLQLFLYFGAPGNDQTLVLHFDAPKLSCHHVQPTSHSTISWVQPPTTANVLGNTYTTHSHRHSIRDCNCNTQF